MTKIEQQKINSTVSTMRKSIGNDFWSAPCERLRSCSAIVYRDGGKRILRSYNTIVAVIENGVCYDFLREVYGYTATSAQHISKFCHDYGARERMTWRDC